MRTLSKEHPQDTIYIYKLSTYYLQTIYALSRTPLTLSAWWFSITRGSPSRATWTTPPPCSTDTWSPTSPRRSGTFWKHLSCVLFYSLLFNHFIIFARPSLSSATWTRPTPWPSSGWSPPATRCWWRPRITSSSSCCSRTSTLINHEPSSFSAIFLDI